MPRDVATRWNSTYDLLAFALEYRTAIDDIAGARDLGLRKYELKEEEWNIVKQLCDVLKVCKCIHVCSLTLSFMAMFPRIGFKRRYTVFLSVYAQSSNGHSGHGSH